MVPVKLVATIITLASGGSAGKEGPCAQIGVGLASTFASIARLPDSDRKKLVICGISAGFATVFGTPIAGALFGIEVLVLGQMMYEVLFPSFVAGIVGYHVAMAMEKFGSAIGTHAAVACLTSFLIVGYNSVYPSQSVGNSEEWLPIGP